MSARPARFALLLAAALMLGACSTTRFYPHEATENVHVGKGGSRFTVEGIDVWFNGEPPGRYAILGYIEDPRGLYADEDHRTVESGVLKQAHAIGASALIEVELPGARPMPSSGLFFGSSMGRGYRGMGMGMEFGMGPDRIAVKYIAVRYLNPR